MSGGKAPEWKAGQLLQATVGRSEAGRILLQIGHRQVVAETSLPLKPGQQLNLRVLETGRLPVLRILPTLTDDPVADAVRQLLPRQAPLAPLLGMLASVARQPSPPLPPLVSEAIRQLVAQLAGTGQISSAAGLKKALQNSGVFLDERLRAAAADARPLQADMDFKTNLLRLINLVRNWPGSPQAQPARTAATPPRQHPDGGTSPTHARADTGPPAAAGRQPGGETTPPRGAGLPPERLQQLLRPAAPAPDNSRAAAPAAGTSSSPVPVAGRPSTPAGAAQPIPPPPLRGAPPQPQAVVNQDIELLSRLGTLRTTLLQQSEAALARLQLSQLAAVPREGERGLIEWLFDLPVRRGDDIDLWSVRIFREAEQQPRRNRPRSDTWTVQLAFDLPGLGAMQAQVRLHNETVSARFWASNPDTVPLLEQHLHELRRSLLAAGLEVSDIDCCHGTLPAAGPPSGDPLIDEQA